jgi:phage-related protein (TIGR01555 family)
MSFAGIPDIIDRFQIAASGAARMPRAMLFGTSAGGLGATGEMEIRNYYDIIAAIQENDLQPEMRVLDAMIVKTALGSIPPEIHYNWRSLYQIDDKTKAEIGNMIVKKYVDAVGAGIFPEELAYKQIVNELTEAGVSPGLENAAEEYAGGLADDVDEGNIDA